MFHKKTNTTIDKQSSSIPFIFGFVSGIIAGVLFAPKQGTETRKALTKTISSLATTFEESEIGHKVKTNENVIKATNTLSDTVNDAITIKKNIEKKATLITKSPIAKKILTSSLSEIKPALTKKTGRKFTSKKK